MKLILRFLLLTGSFVFAQSSWTNVHSISSPGDVEVAPNSDVYSIQNNFDEENFEFTKPTLYKSTNEGVSWSEINTTGFPSQFGTYLLCRAIVIEGSTFFLGLEGGIYKSTDGGSTWSAANTGYNTYYGLRCLSSDGIGNLYALAYDYLINDVYEFHLYKSTNLGVSWTEITTTGISTRQPRSLTANGTTLYAGFDDGVYRSTNSGVNWSAINSGINAQHEVADLEMGPSGHVYLLALESQSTDAAVKLYKSVNSGDSWSLQTASGFATSDFTACQLSIGTSSYASINNHGIYKASGLITSVFESDTDILNTIFPNPAHSTVNVPERTNHVHLQNSIGTTYTVLEIKDAQLSLEDIEPGLYFMQGFDGNNQLIFTEKLVVQ